MSKICSTCGIEKDIDNFYRDVSKEDGYRNNCKQCSSINKNYEKNLNSVSEKICSSCKRLLPLNLFIRDKRRALGYGMICLPCSTNKQCRKCQKVKHVSKFNTSNRSADGYGYSCKECINEQVRERYKRDASGWHESRARYVHTKKSREGRRERLLFRQYGLTLNDYKDMFEEQDGLCAICQKRSRTQDRAYLSVDHSHQCCPGTRSCGKCIRGLLCDPCNRAIGMFLEDPKILLRAIDYLENQGFVK